MNRNVYGERMTKPKSKSLFSDERICIKCGSPYVEVHHIFNGANRNKSDEEGCWCYLCTRCHRTSNKAVHRNSKEMRGLKRLCQQKWETRYRENNSDDSREAFIRTFRKSYL